ncbi:MAG: tetratricopeptide repeat protein, partial [Acidobacteriota bacterium]
MRVALALLSLLLLGAAPPPPDLQAPMPEKALELRNVGIAQLENEQPAQAEATFRELIKAAPADPLPSANLALSLLRQQKNDAALEAADQALAKAPGRADLLALRGDILQWAGKADEALAAYRRAVAADPAQVRVQFALFQQAAALGETETAQAASTEALAALVKLRPENLVV